MDLEGNIYDVTKGDYPPDERDLADAEMITVHWTDDAGNDEWRTLVGGFEDYDDFEYAVAALFDAYSGELG
jgi:hypothetical protein